MTIGVGRMKKIGLILMILPIILPVSGWADDFEQLRKNSARVSTVSADFVQKKIMKILSKPMVSEGKFYYAAPDAVRWEYSKPLKSVVLSRQGNTKRYMASRGKMIEDKTGGAQSMKIVLDEVAGWMRGRFDSNPSFKATLKEGPNTVITLTPVGKGMDGMIEKIEITVSQKDMSVKTVRIIESANAETRIDFLNVVMNKEIKPSVFQGIE